VDTQALRRLDGRELSGQRHGYGQTPLPQLLKLNVPDNSWLADVVVPSVVV
jgi:hypothetical protein